MSEILLRRVKILSEREALIHRRLHSAQNARLVMAGLSFLLLVFATVEPGPRLEVIAVGGFIVTFVPLVWRTRRLARFATRLRLLREFYQRQRARGNGEAAVRDWQQAMNEVPEDADRSMISDLNLLGAHSLFTMIDETISDGGRRELLHHMLHPQMTREQILHHQEFIAALAKERWFLIRLLIAGQEEDPSFSTSEALRFMQKPLLTQAESRSIWLVISVWLACFAGMLWATLSGALNPAFFIMTFVAINLVVMNRIGPVFRTGVGLAHHLATLVALLDMIEKRTNSPTLRKLAPTVFAARPSRQLLRFNFVLAFLSTEGNPIVSMFLNALVPWAGFFSLLLEKRRATLAASVPACVREFNRIEVILSLSFVYVYQTRAFPEIAAEPCLEFNTLYHPLIPRQQAIANDFAFGRGKHLGLITGSNMSGKSTFLRTIGINQVLTNMGAPVYATQLKTNVFQIGSCIQVSDSLRDGFSYFYSEVLRLKSLIEDVKSGRPVLFLIDEIFRGTNNRERQIGSRAVIHALIARTSFGFVSTHDLELTNIEERLPEVINLHFREEIRGGEMHFSYKLQSGPCPTTNALKIMESAGLDLRHG